MRDPFRPVGAFHDTLEHEEGDTIAVGGSFWLIERRRSRFGGIAMLECVEVPLTDDVHGEPREFEVRYEFDLHF